MGALSLRGERDGGVILANRISFFLVSCATTNLFVLLALLCLIDDRYARSSLACAIACPAHA